MRIRAGALGAVAGTALALGLLGAAPASASLERVGCFAGGPPGKPCKPIDPEKEGFGEEVQLGGLGGMAVNYTGAGGVPAGTVYAASWGSVGGIVRIAMYTPKVNPLTSERELEFALSWEVTVLEGPYDRCGPDLLPPTKCPPRVKAEPGRVDVDVDQATGNLYAYNATRTAGRNAIVAYDATGSEVIARFGEIAPAGKTTAETPALLHDPYVGGGLAVNDSGEVYIYDANGSGSAEYHRLMKFRPKVAGKYDEYEYAGAAEDLGAGLPGEGRRPLEPVTDEAGDLYVAPDQSHVEKYDASHPSDPPICDFSFAKGGITAIAVDPKGKTPFFFTYKTPKRLYQLGPCNPATGQFEGGVIGETIVTPERDDLYGLAFDPVAKFSPTRSPGVLYGGAPNPTSSNGVGEGEKEQSSLGYIFAPPEENPPAVQAQSVSAVSEASARLGAVIDPKSSKTHYVFQYLTEAAYQEGGESFQGAMQAPLGGAFLSGAAQSVAATLTGLSPDTAYRYRALATSSCAPKEPGKVCEDIGQAEAFHTYPSEEPGPRDHRAFELVSPPDKNGGQVLPAEPGISSCGAEAECKPGDTYDHFPMQSSAAGDAVVYEGTSFAPGTGVALGNSYIARRDPQTGWRSANLTPALMQKEGRGYKAFDEALSRGLFGQTGPALSPTAPPEFKNLYIRQTSSPFALSPLLSAAPPNRPATESEAFEAKYAGASADLSRIFFTANDALSEEVPGIAPAAEDGGAAKLNLYEFEAATGQLRLVNVLPGNTTTEAGASIAAPSTGAVSAEGSRVFWSEEAGQLYVRIDGSETRKVEDPGKFLSASREGSKVLLANGHLYDLQAEETTDLTAGKGGFEGLAGQSEDLSHLYFVDEEVLSGQEANSEGAVAQAGKDNLYAWSEEGPTRYVATLLASDDSGSNLARSATWSPLPSQRTAEASPNGRYLAFLSQADLTDFDNSGPCESNHAHGFLEAPCPEVFLYDSEAETLICASCNRSGARPLGLSALRTIRGGEDLPQPRYLTDSGRLYFDSQDALSQFDTNDGVEDVYEFEPEGVGGCEREGGCTGLISSGHDSSDANLLALDASGANVFFTTRNRLISADEDELIDLYVAREGGVSFESQPPQPRCQGESCQPTPPAAPGAAPASLTLADPGNVRQAGPCGKTRVRRKGRCVKGHKQKKAKHARAKRGGGR